MWVRVLTKLCTNYGLIAFFHRNLLLARSLLIFFFFKSLDITSDHLSLGLPLGFGPPTSKSIIFFDQRLSSCLCRWPKSLKRFQRRTSSIWSIFSLSLKLCVECCWSRRTPQVHLIIAWSLLCSLSKSSLDIGQVSLPWKRTPQTHEENTFPLRA